MGRSRDIRENDMLKHINWIGVLVSVVLLEVLGYLYYGPVFGEAWMAARGGVAPDMTNAAMTYSLGAANTLIVVIGLDWLLRRLGATSLSATVTGTLMAWLFFNFTTMAIDYLYVELNAQLVLINMGYQLLAYLVAGLVFGLIRPRTS